MRDCSIPGERDVALWLPIISNLDSRVSTDFFDGSFCRPSQIIVHNHDAVGERTSGRLVLKHVKHRPKLILPSVGANANGYVWRLAHIDEPLSKRRRPFRALWEPWRLARLAGPPASGCAKKAAPTAAFALADGTPSTRAVSASHADSTRPI